MSTVADDIHEHEPENPEVHADFPEHSMRSLRCSLSIVTAALSSMPSGR